MTSKETVLYLLRVALGEGSAKGSSLNASCVNWQEVMDVASQQGVVGVCFEGIELLSASARPDMDNLMDWLGQTLYMETCYEEHLKVVRDLAAFYSSIGVRMMLLKGYGLSHYWPKANHRPVGDIDIFLTKEVSGGSPSTCSGQALVSEGVWQEADRLIHEKLGIEVDNGHHHHSVFTFEGVMVENHYDFINVHSHRSNMWIEQMFKDMASGGFEVADGKIENLYYPSPALNALFVARHNAIHFASEKMTLRQLLDWAFLVKACHQVIDWRDFWEKVTRMGMLDFVLAMNEICVKQFGFSDEIFHEHPGFKRKDGLAESMLTDIFEPEDTGEHLKGLPYLKHRTRLWWTNRWKHKMVYSDSMLSTLFAQIKSHLMRPKTIFGV